MTAWILLDDSALISRHIAPLCNEAAQYTYVRDVDLRIWSEIPGASFSSLESATSKFPLVNSKRCSETSNLKTGCTCSLEICIGWYPCGLKYCKGKSEIGSGNIANYRCGIKTCRKCNQFVYFVKQKQQCLWDE